MTTASNGRISAAAAHDGRDRSPEQVAARVGYECPPQDSDRNRKARRQRVTWRGKPGSERAFGIVAQLVDLCDAMHAPYGAEGRTVLVPVVLRPQVVFAVLFERNARVPALLRAPVHKTVLAHIQVPRAGAAVPLVGCTLR